MSARVWLPDLVGGGYGEFWRTRCRYRVVKGSRASKKSKTTALWYIYHLLRHPAANLLVVRRTYRTLERSAYSELRWAIRRLGAEGLFDFRTAPLEIIHRGTGQRILFAGLDDPLKLTSLTVTQGVLCWMWIEEAYELESEDVFNTLDETIRGEVPDGLFKQITLTFNPWSENHWLKRRFFDRVSPDVFAMTVNYTVNEWLDDADRRMFAEMRERDPERFRVCGLGEWGVGGGQFFSEWRSDVHVQPPLPLPPEVRIYRAIDYGLDALACVFVAVDTAGRATVFREVYEKGLIVSEAAQAVLRASEGLDVYCTFAPPDLWARQKDSGKSMALLFAEHGLPLIAASADRLGGWMALREWLKVENGDARMKVSRVCENLIRCLPALVADGTRVGDCATEPHELTHLPDALRYFAVMKTHAPPVRRAPRFTDFTGKKRNRF